MSLRSRARRTAWQDGHQRPPARGGGQARSFTSPGWPVTCAAWGPPRWPPTQGGFGRAHGRQLAAHSLRAWRGVTVPSHGLPDLSDDCFPTGCCGPPRPPPHCRGPGRTGEQAATETDGSPLPRPSPGHLAVVTRTPAVAAHSPPALARPSPASHLAKGRPGGWGHRSRLPQPPSSHTGAPPPVAPGAPPPLARHLRLSTPSALQLLPWPRATCAPGPLRPGHRPALPATRPGDHSLLGRSSQGIPRLHRHTYTHSLKDRNKVTRHGGTWLAHCWSARRFIWGL